MIVLRHAFCRAEVSSGRGIALAVGNFDGVHLGHRALLARVLECDSLLPACMTFEPHPRAVLRPDAPNSRICGPADKLRILAGLGVAAVFMPRFSAAFAQTSADEFAGILLDKIGAKKIVVGENFKFGKGRRGDCDLLVRAARKRGAECVPVPLAQTPDGAPVSSGRIREVLSVGDFQAAAKLLGGAWTLRGRIIHGMGYGRRLGFPTANLHLRFSPPARGIFAASAMLDGESTPRPAAVSAGVNPSVSDAGALKVEAHLPGFSGDLYGRVLTLRPLAKLRDEKKFPDGESLRAAMAEDVARALEIWRRGAG